MMIGPKPIDVFLLLDIYGKTTMEDLNNQITLIRTELNLEQDPQKKQDLNKRLNVLNLKKEIETIKKRIEQIGWTSFNTPNPSVILTIC